MTARYDLWELNELNFARFDAKIERRLAELRAEMQAAFARVEADRRMDEVRADIRTGFATYEAHIERRLAEFESRVTRRMLWFWITQGATTVALVLGVVNLVGR